MKRDLGRVVVVACILLAALFTTSCSSIEAPRVVLSGVELDGLSVDGIELLLLTSVTNMNGFAADIGRLEYRVDVDGAEVAKGERSQKITVGARETVDVEIPFSLTWAGLEKGLSRYFDGSRHDWKLSGSAQVSKGPLSKTFRFAESGEFTGPDADDIRFDF
jgi:hypothetical protein